MLWPHSLELRKSKSIIYSRHVGLCSPSSWWCWWTLSLTLCTTPTILTTTILSSLTNYDGFRQVFKCYLWLWWCTQGRRFNAGPCLSRTYRLFYYWSGLTPLFSYSYIWYLHDSDLCTRFSFFWPTTRLFSPSPRLLPFVPPSSAQLSKLVFFLWCTAFLHPQSLPSFSQMILLSSSDSPYVWKSLFIFRLHYHHVWIQLFDQFRSPILRRCNTKLSCFLYQSL